MKGKQLIMKMKIASAPHPNQAGFCDSIWQNAVATWYNGVKFRKILGISAISTAKFQRAQVDLMLAGGAAQ